MSVKLKICGLYREEDIQYINEIKPDFCGFILHFPKSHRNVSVKKVRELCSRLDKGILSVGVFVDQPIDIVAELILDGTLNGAQLHGNESEEYIENLRMKVRQEMQGKDKGFFIIKAYTIKGKADLEVAKNSSADHILLDSGKGSGQTFDWEWLSGYERPFILAGGLTPHNLELAIKMVNPYGVDISSGVEENGIKNREKILKTYSIIKGSDG